MHEHEYKPAAISRRRRFYRLPGINHDDNTFMFSHHYALLRFRISRSTNPTIHIPKTKTFQTPHTSLRNTPSPAIQEKSREKSTLEWVNCSDLHTGMQIRLDNCQIVD